MPNELSVVNADVLTEDEKKELDKSVENIILAHKENRQEINRLVFESVAAMTEADSAQTELSKKGMFSRFIGGITGSNQKLQNKINENRALAQYASQQTLQKLAEQNLMSFDLITAVNNKLNASMNAVNNEFKEIYAGLNKFLKYNRNELIRVEMRLERIEQNVNLLTWQNSIEYLEYEGEEYRDMDVTKKIVCLTRDFYEITKGKWSTSDLLLLKTAMSTIDIQPRDQVNYYGVLREISHNKKLKNKLLGNADIRPIEDPAYLISMGTMEKLDALEERESYIVDTVMGYMNQNNIQAKREDVCDSLTYNYLKERADVNLDMNVDSYDLILDLLYNIKQAEADNLLMMPIDEQEKKLHEAKLLYLHCKFEESLPMFKILADEGNARAMYFLGKLYSNDLPKDKKNKELGTSWRRKGAELGDVLCRLNMAYIPGTRDEQKKSIFTSIEPELKNLANEGDMFAQNELGLVCKFLNDESAMDWYKKSASQGYYLSMNNLGNEYYNQGDYEDANKWYKLAGEAGYDWGWYYLAYNYRKGNGVEKDDDKAMELYKRAYNIGGNAAGHSADLIGLIYDNRGDYEDANKWYELAVEAGYDWGWNHLAYNYFTGNGVEKDDDKAMELYKKAYELNGEAAGKSAYALGLIYDNRDDYEDANKWYEVAGEAGCDWGWHDLANAYSNGNGVEKDDDKAMELYKRAYNIGGNAAGHSANVIGIIYYNRDDYEDANKWYELAGESGYDWGWKNLADDYLRGYGFSKDVDKARYYYEKACELNGEAKGNAAYQIATIYNDKCEYNEARKWYRIAADAGNKDAKMYADLMLLLLG